MLNFPRLFLPFMAGCILTATMGNTAFSAESRIAGSTSASGTWTSKSCPERDDNQWMLVGLKLVKHYNKTQQVAAICKGGMPSNRGNILWSSAGRPPYTTTSDFVPTSTPQRTSTTDFVCPRNTFVTGVGAYFLNSTKQITSISLACASYNLSNGNWSPGQLSTITSGSPAATPNNCGSNRPAKKLKIRVGYGVPNGLRLECDNAAPMRQLSDADLLPRRRPRVTDPFLGDPNKAYQPNGIVTFAMKRAMPGASKYKATLFARGVPSQNFNNLTGRQIGQSFIIEPQRFNAAFNDKRVSFRFYACTSSNRCSRPATGAFYACSRTTGRDGCAASGMIGGMGSGGSGKGGGGSMTPTLSFAQDLYPKITSQCSGCHSGNSLYPQKLQTNARECGVTSAPSIPFSTSMSAPTMLNRLKCLKASSTQGVYQRALGKKYVVPGNYSNSGLHWKAQASGAFSPEVRNLIRDWIAQGARP